MNERDGFVFVILFLFQCLMMTAFRFWRIEYFVEGITSALIAGICVLILLTLPDELENEGESDNHRQHVDVD